MLSAFGAVTRWLFVFAVLLAFCIYKICQFYSVLVVRLGISFIDRIILPQFYSGADKRSLFVGSGEAGGQRGRGAEGELNYFCLLSPVSKLADN